MAILGKLFLNMGGYLQLLLSWPSTRRCSANVFERLQKRLLRYSSILVFSSLCISLHPLCLYVSCCSYCNIDPELWRFACKFQRAHAVSIPFAPCSIVFGVLSEITFLRQTPEISISGGFCFTFRQAKTTFPRV